MIKYYLKTLKSREMKEMGTFRPGSWVYVQDPTDKEIDYLTEKFELDPGHLEDARDNDEMPRLEKEGDHIYLFTRFAYTEEDLAATTTPLAIIFHDKCLITISKEEIPDLERLLNGKLKVNTTQHGKLALQILDRIDDRFEKYIGDISKQIKTTRTRLRVEKINNRDFIDFVLIEDELNEFMTALTPMTPILKRLMLGRHFQMHAEDKDLLEDLLLNNEQSLEACSSNIKSIVNIREAYSTIMSNDLNRVIRILTVVTAVISVPTLIASIYGMNVALPLDHWSSAFVILIIGSFVISILLIIYFKIIKWL